MLTVAEINGLKPSDKSYLKHDGEGLYIEVPKSGSKRWRFKFSYGGRAVLMSFGTYPDVSLKDARAMRIDARSLLNRGVNPAAQRKALKDSYANNQANTFEVIAREWLESVHKHKVSSSQYERNKRRLELYVFPKFGRQAVSEIKSADLLRSLKDVESSGKAETASRVRTLMGQVFTYAIITERTTTNPAQLLARALKSKEVQHHRAITEPSLLAELLRAIDTYKGHVLTQYALKISSLIPSRPNEIRQMLWSDIDINKGTWHYKPSKGGKPMLVCLPQQALSVFKEAYAISAKNSIYVFPSIRSNNRPISDATVNAAIARMGFGDVQNAHGFRATFRTMIVDQLRLNYHKDILEMQLGHTVKDPNGGAYDRATFYDERTDVLQKWADYLDELRDS